MITETLAFHDRATEDLPDFGLTSDGGGHNETRADLAGAANQADRQAVLTTGT